MIGEDKIKAIEQTIVDKLIGNMGNNDNVDKLTKAIILISAKISTMALIEYAKLSE